MSDAIDVMPLAGPVHATVPIPGSKSLTNRALLLAALADGASTLDGVLLADDTDAMLAALRTLEVRCELDRERRRAVVRGVSGRIAAGEATIDARRSGTTARFLLPVLGAADGRYRITGTPQLRTRPMGDLIAAIRSMGSTVTEEGTPGHLPVVVGGGYRSDSVALRGDVTSQFLSGLMMVAPLLSGGLTIDVTTELASRPYVDMTAASMRNFGAHATVTARRIQVSGGGYHGADVTIEPDASAASYFFAAAALAGGSVTVTGITRSSTQGDVRFVDVLAEMGAEVVEHDDAIEVRGTGRLRGVDVDLHDMPDMALTVAALAPFAQGATTVSGVATIRGHESDRISVIATELGKLGVPVHEDEDGFRIDPAGPLRPASIDTYEDHRVAMAFALIGLRTPGVRINDPGCVGKTFPEYWDVLSSLRGR